MARPATMAGSASIGIDKVTHDKLKQLANGQPIAEYLRQIVREKESEGGGLQSAFTPLTPSDRVARIETGMNNIMSAIQIMLSLNPRTKITPEEYQIVKNSRLHFLLDEEIAQTFRQFYEALVTFVKKNALLNSTNEPGATR